MTTTKVRRRKNQAPQTPDEMRELILASVKPDPNNCWIWQLYKHQLGYGQVQWRIDGPPSKTYLAHRASYLLFVGPIPPGLEIDHLCRVRSCVNPDHLETVTHAENIRRAAPYRTYGKNPS